MINIEKLADDMMGIIGTTPISIHMDIIGLFKLGRTNEQRLENFRKFLLAVESKGGTILIPSYSMSYTSKKNYDIKNSPSVVGLVTEYLRKLDYEKRSIDPIFSYLVYSQNPVFLKHLKQKKIYNSFGQDGIVEKLYEQDGFLGAIGCGIKTLTEIYFIEQIRKCEYRKNIYFSGQSIFLQGKMLDTKCLYYCRDIQNYPKLFSSFKQLEDDLKSDDHINVFNIDNKLLISNIRFQMLEKYILQKTSVDSYYLTNHKESYNV